MPLHGVDQGQKQAHHQQHLKPHAFAMVVFWFSCPAQEGTHILGYLGHGSWGAIIKLQDLIVDWRGHANGLARKIRVEVEAFSQRHPSGRLTVAGEQGKT